MRNPLFLTLCLDIPPIGHQLLLLSKPKQGTSVLSAVGNSRRAIAVFRFTIKTIHLKIPPILLIFRCFALLYIESVKTLTFNDEEAIAPLSRLQASFPNAAIYLTGSLTIDFPEEVKLPTLANQYESIAITGTTVKMDYEPIEGAIALMSGQFAVGTLSAKIIQPSPEFK